VENLVEDPVELLVEDPVEDPVEEEAEDPVEEGAEVLVEVLVEDPVEVLVAVHPVEDKVMMTYNPRQRLMLKTQICKNQKKTKSKEILGV